LKPDLSFFNLFFEVWIRPRKVTKLILENHPGYYVWSIVITLSVLRSLNSFSLLSLDNYLPFPFSVLVGIVVWSIFEILAFLSYSYFILRIGKWLGGKGNYLEVKTACAWAYPPTIAVIFFDYLRDIPNLTKIFYGNMYMKDLLATPKGGWYYVLTTIGFIPFFWGIGLNVINISEALKITIKKSITIFAIIWGTGLVLFLIVFFYFYFFQLRGPVYPK